MQETIGRYQILEELGRGTMAVVYKVFDPEINRTLAIKLLRMERCGDAEYRSRFLREARTAGTLSHKNIVTVYDVQEQDDRPYIAMELLEGEDLEEIIASGNRLPLDDILNIGIQLADALDYAHSRGIVHRDVKPSNIVLLQDEATIKITDFGIAHVEDKDASEITRVGTILGTPYYMAPEQMEAKAVDGRSDLFSVGVILYELITGKKPFKGENLAAVYQSIINKERRPIEELAPNTPAVLIDIIDGLLNKDMGKRFQTGKELAQALDRVRTDLQGNESDHRLLATRLKWPLLMGIGIAIVMLVGTAIAYRIQYHFATLLVFEYGSSLAKLIAAENAEAVLTENWSVVQSVVDRIGENKSLNYLNITDHKDVIKSGTDATLIGKRYETPKSISVFTDQDGITIYGSVTLYGVAVFHFDAPILFQGTEVGRLHFGLAQAPLRHVMELSLIMLGALVAVTIVIAVLTTHLLNSWVSRSVRTLKKSLQELAKGRYEHRVNDKRRDAFAQLFSAFNRLAEALQYKRDKTVTKGAKTAAQTRSTKVPPLEQS